jgi:porcupine-like protein
MSFRMSHYFICYFCQSICFLNQFEYKNQNKNSIDNSNKIARPYFIEIPRSLSDVVANWNIPMHKWLKKCNI